jgi:hypothetical protein
MTIKEEIIALFNDVNQLNLKDIYSLLPLYKKEIIRGVINTEIKADRTFERIGPGIYKIKVSTGNEGYNDVKTLKSITSVSNGTEKGVNK